MGPSSSSQSIATPGPAYASGGPCSPLLALKLSSDAALNFSSSSGSSHVSTSCCDDCSDGASKWAIKPRLEPISTVCTRREGSTCALSHQKLHTDTRSL